MSKTCPLFVYLNSGTFSDLARNSLRGSRLLAGAYIQVTRFKNTSCKSVIAIKWKLQTQIAYLSQRCLIYEAALTLSNRYPEKRKVTRGA